MKIIIKDIEYTVSEYSELADATCELTFSSKNNSPIKINIQKDCGEYLSISDIFEELEKIQDNGFPN